MLGFAPIGFHFTIRIRHIAVARFAPIAINPAGNAEIQKQLLNTFKQFKVVSG